MNLFKLLQLELPTLTPKECKIHLASWNGRDDPLDVFLSGQFPAWQNWQSHKNFERPFILSLIKLDGPSQWLFAGVHSTHGCRSVSAQQERPWQADREYEATPESAQVKPAFHYTTKELPEFSALTGRLIVAFSRPGRQSYLKAENWAEAMLVHELRPQRLTIREFPGYASVIVSKPELDLIVQQQIPSWKSALVNVAGVYLITDTETGKHYVGSAYGEGGFWQRWSEYSATGHGHNKALKELLTANGLTHAAKFQFSILEIADTHASKDDVIARETHWKNALCSRAVHGGYNAN